MIDAAMLPAIKQALKQNEIGNGSPYCMAYARLGGSGGSFGMFQGDVCVNPKAREVLLGILQRAGLPAAIVTRVMAAVSKPCPDGNPLSAADTTVVNDALAAAAGRTAIDTMDAAILDVVLNNLNESIAAAAKRRFTIAAEAQLYIALWVNMTGEPNKLDLWIGGAAEGVPPPAGPVITAADVRGYLHATQYFTNHPKNFTHMQQSVAAGVPLLPAA
jgi:hypothetical protein